MFSFKSCLCLWLLVGLTEEEEKSVTAGLKPNSSACNFCAQYKEVVCAGWASDDTCCCCVRPVLLIRTPESQIKI